MMYTHKHVFLAFSRWRSSFLCDAVGGVGGGGYPLPLSGTMWVFGGLKMGVPKNVFNKSVLVNNNEYKTGVTSKTLNMKSN